jgi:tape measure domain-containing protein
VSVVANVAINVDSRNAVSKLREVQSQSQQTERAIGGLGGAIGKLAAAFSVIQAAKFVFVSTAEIESQTRSLQVLTGSAEKAGQIVKDLQQLGAVTPFTSSELIDSAKRLQAFGVETNKVVETTRRLADVSGATGAELSGLVTAYGQVQAKGRLQGEELLQFQERGVALQQVLRKEYNLSGEEFQKALEKGRISAQAVEAAIVKLTDAGGKYANGAIAQSDTLNGRFSTLQDSIQVLAQTIGKTLAPVFQWALTQATAVVSEIQRILDEANNAGGARDREAQFARNADAAVRAMRLNPFTQQGMMADMRQRNIEQQRADYRLRQQQARTPSAPSIATMPPLLGATGGTGKKGKLDAEKTAEKAAREAEKLRQELERSLEVGNQLGTQFSRQAALLFESSELERKRLQIQFDFEDRANQISELKNTEQQANLNQLNTEIQRLELIDLQTEALKRQAEEADKLFKAAFEATEFGVSGGGPIANMIQEMQDGLQKFLEPANQIKTAATAIGDAFSTSFKDVITGAKSAQQAIADFFGKIGDALIDYATQAIAQYVAIGFARLFAGIGNFGTDTTGLSFNGSPLSGGKLFPTGAFAEGGFVTGPTRALIGEGGEPEYVIPASKMRGAMGRYAAGARGSSVIPTGGDGGETGGTATMGATTIDVRYSVERINNVDYVTADQFQAGMQQAAAQGAAEGQRQTLRRLQQSPSTRRRIGV